MRVSRVNMYSSVDELRNSSKVNNNDVIIGTHNSGFHADEITSCALINTFYTPEDANVHIVRIGHNDYTGTELRKELKKIADHVFIVDVGAIHDDEEMLFDHHQWSNAESKLSSAGLVYKWLVNHCFIRKAELDELHELIKLIDYNDIGLRQALPGEIPWVLAKYNQEDHYSKEQNKAFRRAMRVMDTIFENIKNMATEMRKTTRELRKGSKYDFNGVEVLWLDEYPQYWERLLPNNGHYKNVEIITWYDSDQDTYKAQVVPVKVGSYERRGQGLTECDECNGKIFIHKAEFFAVFNSRDSLFDYLDKITS